MRTNTQREGKSGVLSYGLYKIYKDRFHGKDVHCEANVGYLKWLRICREFNKRKMESILKGQIFEMPYKLGALGIIQYKKKITFDENGNLITKGMIPDWKKTWMLWRQEYPQFKEKKDFKKIKGKQIVYNTNENTDGRIFKFFWRKRYSNIKNISAYELVIPIKHRLALCRLIRSNPNVQYCTKF